MRQYANIYLVVGILSAFIIFSAISFVYIEDSISNNSSASLHEKRLQD
jgi:hypothetical protein